MVQIGGNTVALLGIDVGTTASKAIVFSDEGKQLGYAYREYPPFENTYETNGNLLWENMCEVIADAVRQAGERAKEIKALAISSFGESFVPIDEYGAVYEQLRYRTEQVAGNTYRK